MLKKIALVVVALVVAVLAFATTKPSELRVQRVATINAAPEKIHELIADFRQWSAWSPWEKLDTAMVRTFSGAARGPGAVYEWAGNRDVGKGRMEITEAPAPSRVAIKLDFLEPIEAHNVTEFALRPEGGATTVTWTMSGPNTYMSKVMSVFVNMDEMIGKDFEAGLANLKTLAER